MTCAFCDSDPCGCYTPAPPPVLEPAALLRLGALTLDVESSEAVEKHLDEQQEVYRNHSKNTLMEALRDRDRLLLNQGRTIADGRMLSRLTRELVRAALYQQGGRPDVAAVEKALQGFGSEPADLRQLALRGSTLGPLEAPGVVAAQLADGKLKER